MTTPYGGRDVVAGNTSSFSWSYTITLPPTGDAPATPGFVLARPAAGAVDAGGSTTLSGVLAPAGQVLAGAKVLLQSRPVTTNGVPLAADWSGVGSGTTAADGSFAFAGLTSQAATEYRAVYTGDPHGAIVSAARKVTVRGVLNLAQPNRRVAQGHKISFHGTLGPSVRGTTVVVKLNGPGRHAVQVRATVDRTGAWTVTVRAPRTPGAWTAAAVWHGNNVLLGDRSPSWTFHILR